MKNLPALKPWHVILYVANLVDYLRYYLSFKGMYYAFDEERWMFFVFYYYVAIMMDAFDGALARKMDQESRYGTCLDMVCDRASVSMMYVVLAQVYPSLEIVFFSFFLLDYGAHFLQFTSNALTKNVSHKNMDDPNEVALVRLYYSNTFFFVLMACGADNGLVMAFVWGRYPAMRENLYFTILFYIVSVIIVMKQLINVGQCLGSIRKLKNYDTQRE
mmetsp:Transcript_2829/g.4832  ORF Transcript_2829/g.4832 Transcript_2829/m.4832 type:complete len:217 (+) Transcript_2829:283-933(+)